ncbi:SRPBCC family protein [Oryzobacter terrae]|uniref:SRPBCC family protein n=1 Tax=Oryzobacter terrae TaxID=1620385 RepID=UPI00366CB5EB
MSTDDRIDTTDTTATTTHEPAGRREDRDGSPFVVLERTFRAPASDVWAAVTEPERLQRWIGTWSGDPATGQVEFLMTAEGDEVDPARTTIHECDPPRRLVLSWDAGSGGGGVWHLELDLAEASGATTLTFAQRIPDLATGRDVGPGWEYYLDRLVAAESGGDVASVAWPEYEGMLGYYADLFADLGGAERVSPGSPAGG